MVETSLTKRQKNGLFYRHIAQPHIQLIISTLNDVSLYTTTFYNINMLRGVKKSGLNVFQIGIKFLTLLIQ